MRQLWQKRVRQHIQEQVKYLKLVFNDHFVLALIFLLGALGYTYANAVKTLDPKAWWLKLLLSLVLLAAVSFGRFATLLKEADSVFLLPKESDLPVYLKAARGYSAWLPVVFTGLVTGLIAPTLLITKTVPSWQLLLVWATLIAIKDRRFSNQLLNWYQIDAKLSKVVWLLIDWLLIVSQLFSGWAIAGVLIASGLAYYQRRQLATIQQATLFDWLAAVSAEDSRMGRIYRLYNLFTDVPGLNSQVKRRRYLDWLLPVAKRVGNPYLYLYTRGFIRGTEFSGLYVRLVVLGGIILCFSHLWWLSLALGLLLIYLVGFQLLPFYTQYEQIIFTHLYPVAKQARVKAFQQLLLGLLLCQAILFSVILLLTMGFSGYVGLSIVALFSLVGVFVQFYLPKRLVK